MKVSGQSTTRQTLRGSISERELLAFVKQTIEVPANANIFFFVRGPGGNDTGVDEEEPLRFTVSWEESAPPRPERDIPTRAIMTVAADRPEPHG